MHPHYPSDSLTLIIHMIEIKLHDDNNKTSVFPIHRSMCGAAPQKQHRVPQIDSAFFFAILKSKYRSVHSCPHSTLSPCHSRTHTQTSAHTCQWCVGIHYHLLDQPAYHWCMHTHWQLIRPLLLLTRLQRKTRSSVIFGTVKTVDDIWRLPICAQTHLLKVIVDIEKRHFSLMNCIDIEHPAP